MFFVPATLEATFCSTLVVSTIEHPSSLQPSLYSSNMLSSVYLLS